MVHALLYRRIGPTALARFGPQAHPQYSLPLKVFAMSTQAVTDSHSIVEAIHSSPTKLVMYIAGGGIKVRGNGPI